jgi:hypothetical protein
MQKESRGNVAQIPRDDPVFVPAHHSRVSMECNLWMKAQRWVNTHIVRKLRMRGICNCQPFDEQSSGSRTMTTVVDGQTLKGFQRMNCSSETYRPWYRWKAYN